jgi:hypothetical protein
MQLLRNIAPSLYYTGLIALAAGLPFWLLLISISQFILLGAWLIDGRLKEKLHHAFTNKVFLVVAGIYILHIAGLAFTTDFKFAFDDLRIKLPLLLLPLVICTMPALPKQKFDFILKTVLVSTLASTLCSTAVWLGLTSVEVHDIRDIAIFVSHIRLSLLIGICLVIIVYFLRSKEKPFTRTAYYLLAAWFIIFLFILQSLTGIVILMVLCLLHLITTAWNTRVAWMKVSVMVVIAGVIAGCSFLYHYIFIDSVKKTEVSPSMMHHRTALGNTYVHKPDYYETENGNPVWINISEEELASAWNKRSNLNYNGPDKRNQELRATLIRFLASKNLLRDASGVNALSDNEVIAVENGIANVNFIDGSSVILRIKQLAWEYRSFYYSGNSSGHSIMQRLEFWKSALYIFKKQPLTGTGTGDVKREYALAYDEMHSSLLPNFRLRAHNQYITMFVTFGVLGGVYFIFAMLYPWFRLRKRNDILYTGFLIIILLSMITEDTPESQAGVSIMAFFNSLFLFHQYGRRSDY